MKVNHTRADTMRDLQTKLAMIGDRQFAFTLHIHNGKETDHHVVVADGFPVGDIGSVESAVHTHLTSWWRHRKRKRK